MAWTKKWRDTFIVNLGTPEDEGKDVHPRDLSGWHVDGDSSTTSTAPSKGSSLRGTSTRTRPACRPSCTPETIPRSPNVPFNSSTEKWFNDMARGCDNFVEAHGAVGDFYLLYPLMLHSASNNALRRVRIITNPPIGLNEPFCFDRPDGNYSLVERTTLRALGEDRLEGWKITAPREEVVPERVKIQEKIGQEEVERLGSRQVAV